MSNEKIIELLREVESETNSRLDKLEKEVKELRIFKVAMRRSYSIPSHILAQERERMEDKPDE